MSSNFISKGAEGYDQYMGRWSKRLAPLFLEFAGAADGERIIDVGCGTGSLTFLIPDRANISTIEAIDYEEQFVDALRQRSTDLRITARRGDACALPFGENQFDRALSMLVLHFVSDARKAVAEMFRVVRPGGVAAATVWDTFGGMPSQRIFWDTIAAIEPSAVARRCAALVRPMTFPSEMTGAFAGAGLQDVTEATLTIRMEFTEFDDYWLPLINGQGTLAAFLSTLPNGIPEQVKASVRQAYLCGLAHAALRVWLGRSKELCQRNSGRGLPQPSGWSAVGTFRTSNCRCVMSGVGGEADIETAGRHFRV